MTENRKITKSLHLISQAVTPPLLGHRLGGKEASKGALGSSTRTMKTMKLTQNLNILKVSGQIRTLTLGKKVQSSGDLKEQVPFKALAAT